MTRVTNDPVSAIAEFGRLFVLTNAGTVKTVHLRGPDQCSQLPATARVREITHPGELPLGAERVCSQCQEDFGDGEAFERQSTGDKKPEAAD